MSELRTLHLAQSPRGRAAALPPCRWLASLELLNIDGPAEVTTGDAETCALLLSGTFDLHGGPTAWPSRGARSTPLHGRPVAVFLPPRTPFRAQGKGEILLVAARQPLAPAATGRAALQQNPLLPLAGSGKAFDPGSGQWLPAESFPGAAESLPPRRLQRVEVGSIAVERVFAADYKAATLSVDEAVLQDGGALALGELPLPKASECLLYVRAQGRLRVIAGAAATEVEGEAAVLWTGAPGALRFEASGGAAYVALAYAGK